MAISLLFLLVAILGSEHIAGSLLEVNASFATSNTVFGSIENATSTLLVDLQYPKGLCVRARDGLWNNTSSTVDVNAGEPPVANFTVSPNPKANQPVTFNATSSYDPDGMVTSYAWDFGDGNGTSVATPVINHPYTIAGPYQVTLNVTDNDGLWNTTTAFVVVTIEIPVIHDVALTGLSLYRTIVCSGTVTRINVTAENQGNVQETFTVVASYNSTAFKSQTITAGNGSSYALFFNWNTTGVSPGNYTVTVFVGQLVGETDTSDNSLSSMVQVSILGDINGDRRVDMRDVGYAARRFMLGPGDPLWDPKVDMNEDAGIDMTDINTVAQEFGARTA